MNLFTSLDMIPGDIVSLVGGGGKTTSMFRLAREIPGKYKKLITTTTHIFIPPPEQSPCFVTSDADFAPPALFECMEAGQVPTLGSQRLSNHKLKGLTLEQFDQLLGWGKIDFILNEADGSKRLPLKGHLDHEPVIPAATTLAVILVGADILGQTLDSEHVHRPEIAAELTGQKMGSVISPETIARLITHPQGVMRTIPVKARTVVFINKVDCLKSLGEVFRTARLLLGDKIHKVILGSAAGENPITDIISVNSV